jgi:hypothetical protein
MYHRKTSNRLQSSKFAEFYQKNSSFSDRKLPAGRATSASSRATSRSTSTNNSVNTSFVDSREGEYQDEGRRCEPRSSIRITDDDYKVRYSSDIRKAYLEKKFRRDQQRQNQEHRQDKVLIEKKMNIAPEEKGYSVQSNEKHVNRSYTSIFVPSLNRVITIPSPPSSPRPPAGDATPLVILSSPKWRHERNYKDGMPYRNEYHPTYETQTKNRAYYPVNNTTATPHIIPVVSTNHDKEEEAEEDEWYTPTYDKDTSFDSRYNSYENDNSMEKKSQVFTHRPHTARETHSRPKSIQRSSSHTNFFSESFRKVVQMLDGAISANQSPAETVIVKHNSSESNDISAISFNSF